MSGAARVLTSKECVQIIKEKESRRGKGITKDRTRKKERAERRKAKKKQLRETPDKRNKLLDQPTNLMWTKNLQMHLHQGLLHI